MEMIAKYHVSLFVNHSQFSCEAPTAAPTRNCYTATSAETCPTHCVWDGTACHESCFQNPGKKPVTTNETTFYKEIEVETSKDCEFECIHDDRCSQFVYNYRNETCELWDTYTLELELDSLSVVGKFCFDGINDHAKNNLFEAKNCKKYH